METYSDPNQTHQSLGGHERAKALSKEERSAIAKKAAEARWAKISDPNQVAVATNSGTLQIGDIDLECFVLKDRRRLFHKRGIARALGLKSTGGNAFMKTMTRKGIGSVFPTELNEKIKNPIFFQLSDSDPRLADGYEGADLIDICKALIKAERTGKLRDSQKFLADQAEIIIHASAKLGITALIDEATGFLKDKRREEYRELFAGFIRSECAEWEKEFPNQFFDMIYRLYGLKRTNPTSFKHPLFFAKFIRRYIYMPLANSNGAILEMLEEKNPTVYKRGRRFKLFQFLEGIGMNALRQHIWQVVGIGAASKNKNEFNKSFLIAFPPAQPVKDQLSLFE